MKQFLRHLIIASTACVASCGHSTVTPAQPTDSALAFARARAIPQTVHVIPFYDYGKNGYGFAGTGSNGALIGDETALYGDTVFGGDSNCSSPYDSGSNTGCGIVYRLVPSKKKENYKIDVIHTFEGGTTDGAASLAPLLADKSGNLYGTTFYGGAYGGGVLFELQPSASGQYAESIVHSFGYGSDGAYPASGVIEVKGVLYGTTLGGGTYLDKPICGTRKGGSPDGKCGTLYSVNPATGAEQVLHNFGASTDGSSPWAPPLDVNGTLYGTTYLGGTVQLCGTVYSIGLDGSNEHVIHSFLNNPIDGCDPLASLIAAKGTLYGTTCCGGAYYTPGHQGTIFSIDIATGVEQVLHSFGYGPDGSEPVAPLVDIGGALYGTTATGGSHICASGPCGTIFSYVPSPSNPSYSVIYNFNKGRNGNYPRAGLLNSNGALYGTTVGGGKKGLGTAIKFSQ